MKELCSPAIIYLLFSITQILIDTYNKLYNTVFVKIIVTVMVTLLLNILCERGLGIVSWIIVFIPFILMTVIVSMILYVFGLDVATGTVPPSKLVPLGNNNPIPNPNPNQNINPNPSQLPNPAPNQLPNPNQIPNPNPSQIPPMN